LLPPSHLFFFLFTSPPQLFSTPLSFFLETENKQHVRIASSIFYNTRSPPRNSTLTSSTYWGQYEEIGQYNPEFNVAERLWAAWYAWMQNDVLATGIMSFAMHELVYFGRSLPWIFIDTLGFFKGYKIQSVGAIRNTGCLARES
jgi:hypothetical protein